MILIWSRITSPPLSTGNYITSTMINIKQENADHAKKKPRSYVEAEQSILYP
jgi:hypothetical protein